MKIPTVVVATILGLVIGAGLGAGAMMAFGHLQPQGVSPASPKAGPAGKGGKAPAKADEKPANAQQ